MTRDRLTYLFYRYLENRCSEEEQSEFLRLVDTPLGKETLDALLHELWQNTKPVSLSDDTKTKLIDAIAEDDSRSISGKSTRTIRWKVYSMAAAIAIFFLVGGWHLMPVQEPAENFVAEVQVPNRYLKLSDGSTVLLKAGSKLTFPDTFEGDVRAVSLVGEAYFDIAHDPTRRFIVHTGKIRTTVLGTAFNIRAYAGQDDIVVTVTRGKVEVSDDRKVLGVVTRDRQITLRAEQQTAEEQEVDSRELIRWIEKDIFFDDLTMTDVAEQLEKRFDVRIHFEDTVTRRCRLTATFVRGESIGQILDIIGEFNGAQVEETKPGNFVIRGGSCSEQPITTNM